MALSSKVVLTLLAAVFVLIVLTEANSHEHHEHDHREHDHREHDHREHDYRHYGNDRRRGRFYGGWGRPYVQPYGYVPYGSGVGMGAAGAQSQSMSMSSSSAGAGGMGGGYVGKR